MTYAAHPGALQPQGLVGSMLGGMVGNLAGSGIGSLFGNASAGGRIGSTIGSAGGILLPFQAGPQLAPAGFFGDLASQIAPVAGGAIGQIFGNQGMGQQIGSLVGQGARLLPFQAGPQLAPAGFFGDLAGTLAPVAGGAIGQIFGNQGMGQQIGSLVGQGARLLPFQAGPQLAPAGLITDLISDIF